MVSMSVDYGTINVWWVNQNRSFNEESRGGYIWAPDANVSGGTVPHYDSLLDVRIGDFIVHFAGGHIRAVSVVATRSQPAVCPRPGDRSYGGRSGRLVKTHYHALPEAIPLEAARNVNILPLRLRPFNSAGGVNEGYLFQYGEAAFVELVTTHKIDWPDEVRDFVNSRLEVRMPADQVKLLEFTQQLCNLNVSVSQGTQRLYKPLLLLAAARAIIHGETLAYSGSLRTYYREFVQAIDAGSDDPALPYFHLTNDGFWRILRSGDDSRPFDGRPGPRQLAQTRAEFVDGTDEFILRTEWRPYVFRALSTYFTRDQWDGLVSLWPELNEAKGVSLARTRPSDKSVAQTSGRAASLVVSSALALDSIAANFSRALQASHLRFGQNHDDFVRRFVASLAAKPFVILTGLSGSGKTQIAQQFGHWVGEEQLLVVPVRPDWTGPDALLGYEDALRPMANDGYRAWHVPEALYFMLTAAYDPERPYVLVLDEMNLAHVERYFADVLSGMESGEPCLPNLEEDDDGHWRPARGGPPTIPVPDNLFIIGTVNVDETTYMFSPKVLDRANTIEFRVESGDLMADARKPTRCEPGPTELVQAFLAAATDPDFHHRWPHPNQDEIAGQLRRLHGLLHDAGFEFGHRVFWESLRFAAMYAAAGDDDTENALDAIVLQKIMPRLHGNRRHLEPVLSTLGRFCFELPGLDEEFDIGGATGFDPLNPPATGDGPRLPGTFVKVQRMTRSVRTNQFASFAE